MNETFAQKGIGMNLKRLVNKFSAERPYLFQSVVKKSETSTCLIIGTIRKVMDPGVVSILLTINSVQINIVQN